MECAKISAGVAVNCDNPLQSGTKDKLYLFNYSDIEDATITRNGVNTQIIEDIVLSSGITGYTIEGINGQHCRSILTLRVLIWEAFHTR